MTPLLSLIRKRHEAQAGWIVLEQVTNGTGHAMAYGKHADKDQHRSADALAIQCFPSRGICAHGFEVKISRSDVLKELRDPEKAEAIQRWCDYWWLVVDDEAIISDLPIPDQWGILAPKKGGRSLREVRKAPKLTPQPWSPRFVAAIIRAFTKGMVPKRALEEVQDTINREVEARLEARVEMVVRHRLHDGEQAIFDLANLRKRVREYTLASGVQIEHEYHPRDLGQVVQAVRGAARGSGRVVGALKAALRDMKELEAWIEPALHAVEGLAAIDDAPDLDDIDDDFDEAATITVHLLGQANVLEADA